MRVLYSSSDLRQQTELVKKLLDRGIPCGLLKKVDNSQLSVWIQHDYNFPQAVDVLSKQNRARPLPGWARAFDKPSLKTKELAGP